MAPPSVTEICPELIHREALPAVPETAQQARQSGRAALSSWGLHPETIDTAVLLLTEVVTNAVKFGAGPQPGDARQVEIVLRYLAGELVIEVTDKSSSPPVLINPDEGTEHGRGLQVVDKLSVRWGYNLLPPGGKTVYCVLGSLEATTIRRATDGDVVAQQANTTKPQQDDPRLELLAKLGAELSSRGVRCALVTSEIAPRLHISGPWLLYGWEDAQFEDNVLAAEFPKGNWQFWWPWVQPIAPVDDIPGVADLLLRELMLDEHDKGGMA